MLKAVDIAKLFIKEGYDVPRNTLNGNMKLQKLLYFSQLIHLAKHGEVLFEEPIFAFEKGSVIEEVRLEYKNNHEKILSEANLMDYNFSDEEMATINATIDMFGDASARELSELNHLYKSWNKSYDRHNVEGYRDKQEAIINVEDMIKYDLNDINKLLEAYYMTSSIDEEFEIINNVKFYYNPNEVEINKGLLDYLKSFPAEEGPYTVCVDQSLGLMVY